MFAFTALLRYTACDYAFSILAGRFAYVLGEGYATQEEYELKSRPSIC
jgi:hypothetical protein